MKKTERVRSKIKKQAGKIRSSGMTPRYMWDASNERVKFWMLNSIFPKNRRGLNILKAIRFASSRKDYSVHIGCGEHGEAVQDLRRMGVRNLIGIDFNPPTEKQEGIEFISLDLSKKLPLETGSVQGVIFGSYLFHYMQPEEQYRLINEVDRLSAPGTYGFLGPFFPQHLNGSIFSKRYPKYKNPLFGLVSERNSRDRKWSLYRSRMAGLGSFSGRQSSAASRKGLRIPFLSFYDMSLRSFMSKVFGNARVRKDYPVKLPVEYFITFEP
ncbi:MAG: methyltransferase domain-containing protein [Candidatus Dojkabacteria bacterium]